MKVQNVKVLILHEGPQRSMKDHIRTMAMFYLMQNMAMDLLGSSRDHTFYGPSKGPKFGPQIQGPECGPRIGTKIWSLIMGPFFGPSMEHFNVVPEKGPKFGPRIGTKSWSLNIGPYFGLSYPWTLNRTTQILIPIYRSTFWTFIKVQNLDLGLKVLILQEGPHRSKKDHIGTMVMFYIRSIAILDFSLLLTI